MAIKTGMTSESMGIVRFLTSKFISDRSMSWFESLRRILGIKDFVGYCMKTNSIIVPGWYMDHILGG